MTPTEAKADIFLLAFYSLPKSEQQAIIQELFSEKEFRQDLLDIAVFESRRDEPSRPIEEYIAERT